MAESPERREEGWTQTHFRERARQGTPAACGTVPVVSSPDPGLVDCPACLRSVARDLAEALREARSCMGWCVDLGADEQTAKSLTSGLKIVDSALVRFKESLGEGQDGP